LENYRNSFITAVGKKYEERIGYGGTFYIASIGDGAREINREVII
jgi:galactokinase